MLPTIDRELSKNTTWLANQYISFLLTVTSPRICFQIWIQLLVLRKSKAADPSSGQFLQATTDDGVTGHLFLCRKTSKKTAVLLYSSYYLLRRCQGRDWLRVYHMYSMAK